MHNQCILFNSVYVYMLLREIQQLLDDKPAIYFDCQFAPLLQPTF